MSTEKKSSSNAFATWLGHISGRNVEEAARILKDLSKKFPGELAWDFLKATGDKKITEQTFLKAARIALGGE